MALTDAFLLEPAPLDIWIAYRMDGCGGSGTQADPFDGSTQERFDSVMASLSDATPVRVHLGPSPRIGGFRPFVTAGFWISADGAVTGSTWQPRPGMVIVGAGREATYLKLAPGAATGCHYFAIGAPTTSPVDFFEVADLTIDASLPTTGSVACGAIRVMGNHVRVRNVKVINWGSRTTAQPGYVVALIIADGDPGSPLTRADDAVIEDCIAVLPSGNNNADAVVHVLHAGGRDLFGGATPADYGRAPVIRNCFVDGGTLIAPGAGAQFRALSMSACRGGIVEGNQIHNVWVGGPYNDRQSIADVIVRNNTYRNVVLGASWKYGIATSLGSGYLSRSGDTVTIVVSSVAGLYPGNLVKLVTNPPSLNGIHVVKTVHGTQPQFTVEVSVPTDMTANVTSAETLFNAGRIVFECNHFEMASSTGQTAVMLDDANQAAGVGKYLVNEAYVRNNKIRYVDSVAPADSGARLFDLRGVRNLIVTDNLFDTIATVPMSNLRCEAATYSGNRKMDGTLLQGRNEGEQVWYDELETENELALVLGMFNRRRR